MKIPMSVLPMWHVAAEENPRYAIHGLRVEQCPNGKLRLVATDGRKLLVAETDGVDVPPDFKDGLVPRGLCRVAAQVGKKLGGRHKAELEFHDKLVSLDVPTAEGRVEMTAPEPEGRFPLWQEVMRDAQRPTMEVPPEQRGSCVAVNLGVPVLLQLLQSLNGMGLDSLEMWLPVAQEVDPCGILFRATGGEGDVRVTGCIMPLSGRLSAPIVIPPETKEQRPLSDREKAEERLACVKSMSRSDALVELGNAVYEGSRLLEELELAGRARGNGHHARQAVAAFAQEELKARWKE